MRTSPPPVKLKPSRPLKLKMPTRPERGADPLVLETVRIYTDVKVRKWRVVGIGQRKDKGFSFSERTQTKAVSWAELLKYVNKGDLV